MFTFFCSYPNIQKNWLYIEYKIIKKHSIIQKGFRKNVFMTFKYNQNIKYVYDSNAQKLIWELKHPERNLS